MKTEVNYVPTDSLAVVQHENSIHWLPVFLRDSDDAPFVRIDGDWVPVAEVGGFQRYEKQRHKKLYNTATGRMVEA